MTGGLAKKWQAAQRMAKRRAAPPSPLAAKRAYKDKMLARLRKAEAGQ